MSSERIFQRTSVVDCSRDTPADDSDFGGCGSAWEDGDIGASEAENGDGINGRKAGDDDDIE